MYSLVDDEYIRHIVEENTPSMYRTAYSLLLNQADAEDAVQEAFVKFFEKKPRLNDEEHTKAWLLRVTINLSKNMLKAASRQELPVTEDIPTEKEETDELLRCVMMLPERYRSVIHLYYYEGYSIKETAAILKLPSATVGTWLARARNLLRKTLEGDVDL